MTQNNNSKTADFNGRLAVVLAMAMFVLVVDTSLMNVSISAVIKDIGATASGVQATIALEALVSAAFILIGSKIGDLMGRKKAYILGLLGYLLGALAMTVAQSLVPIIIFWALVGGIGAALLLPAMQSLVHGNFEGDHQKRAYAIVGASAAIATAVGPLLGGFITTFLSWRVGFLLEVLIIIFVLLNVKLIQDTPYTGPRKADVPGALLSVVAMGGVVLSILVWQEGGDRVLGLLLLGLLAGAVLAYWLVRQKRRGRPALVDPDLFKPKVFRLGISQQMLQQVSLGGLMIVLPMYLQMVQEYNAFQAGLSLMPLSLSMFAVALLIGRIGGRRRPPVVVCTGYALLSVAVAAIIIAVPRVASGWGLAIPLLLGGSGLGLLVSQLNNYTLAPISEERVSEAAGINSAAGSFGLSFGLAFAGAIMLASLSSSFTSAANASSVLQPSQKQAVSSVLQHDAQIMSNTQLSVRLHGQSPAVQEEILRINNESRYHALRVALLVPLVAGLLGLGNSLRMLRQPENVRQKS